ncbi:MAG: hypothetical protein AAGH81_08205 [Bacteroidota bacterium]
MIQRIKKVRAFTINEMLVVLLLTTIVVGIGFAVLQLIQRQMGGIHRNYGHNTELNLLRQSLWIDFNQSDGVWYDSKSGQLFFANEIKEVTYHIHKDKVIKETDTFGIPFREYHFFFKGEVQKEGEIDALDFIGPKGDGSQRLFVFKTNAATSAVNK